MSKLALLGGTPVTKDLLNHARFSRRKDLERKYLLDAYESHVWDWNGKQSQVGKLERDWARFCNARYCVAIPFGAAIAVGSIARVGVGGKAGDRFLVCVGWCWGSSCGYACIEFPPFRTTSPLPWLFDSLVFGSGLFLELGKFADKLVVLNPALQVKRKEFVRALRGLEPGVFSQ